MKCFVFLFVAILVAESCKDRKSEKLPIIKDKFIASDTLTKNRNIEQFLEFSKAYRTNDVNIYKNINDSLRSFDLTFLSSDSSSIVEFERSVYIIFLRQYIHHLEIGKIGFDLKTMCLGDSQFLFNYLIKNVGLESTLEFMQSGYVVDVIKSNKRYLLNDNTVDSLYRKAVSLESSINREHGQ